MKNAKILVSLVLILSLVLCLAACGKDSKSGNLAGKYEFYSMTYGEVTITAADMAAEGQSVEMYVKLNSDGTGIMYSDGETEDIVYANGQIWPVSDPDEKVDFTVVGNTLTMEQDGMEMVFKK